MGFVTGGVTGGAEDSYWRGAGQRTVTGGAEDSHWRGGGQLLEGRRTVTGMTDVPQGHRIKQLLHTPPLNTMNYLHKVVDISRGRRPSEIFTTEGR